MTAATKRAGRPPTVVTDAHRQAVRRSLDAKETAVVPCQDPQSPAARRCLGALRRAAAELGAQIESGEHAEGFWFRTVSKGSAK